VVRQVCPNADGPGPGGALLDSSYSRFVCPELLKEIAGPAALVSGAGRSRVERSRVCASPVFAVSARGSIYPLPDTRYVALPLRIQERFVRVAKSPAGSFSVRALLVAQGSDGTAAHDKALVSCPTTGGRDFRSATVPFKDSGDAEAGRLKGIALTSLTPQPLPKNSHAHTDPRP
jgi:hypothetical protein